MHADDAIIHLAATPQPLSADTDGMDATLGGSRFINAADRLGVGVLACDQPLALVADDPFIPLDGLLLI